MSQRGGGSFGGERRILSAAPSSLIALILALLFAVHPSCAPRAATDGPHSTYAHALVAGLSAANCARPTSGAADPTAPSDRHALSCAICCSMACGGIAPPDLGLVEPHATPAVIAEDRAFLGRSVRRTDSFGRSWSSRAPPFVS